MLKRSPPATLNLFLASVGLLALSACSGSDESPEESPTPSPTPAAVTWHQDVAPILQQRCNGCHQVGGIAPYTFATYDEGKTWASAILDSVVSRRMPPWNVDSSGDCGTYKDARWLSEQELQTLKTWAEGARAEGTPPETPLQPPVIEGLKDVSLSIEMERDYTPREDVNDDYRCFIVEPGLTEDQFITAFHVRPGNTQVVHHVILFDVMGEEGEAQVQKLDEQEAGDGYSCYGGPGSSAASVLLAWAPGSPPTQYPDGTGLKLGAGRKYVVQMHYNTLAGSGPDRTAIDLTLKKSVANQAFILLAGDWDLVLPPNRADASTMVDISMADAGLPIDVTVHAVFPHMHKLGTRMSGEYINEKGSACMAEIPRWDFNWQQFHFFQNPLKVYTHDLIRITCHYDTSARDVITPWGEGTEDEMCILGLYLTKGVANDAVSPLETGKPVSALPGEQSVGKTLTPRSIQSFTGLQDESIRSMALTPSGEKFIVGTTSSTSVTLGSLRLSVPGGGDGWLARLDAQEKVSWARPVGGTGSDSLTELAIGPDGNPVVCGNFSSSDLVLGLQSFASEGDQDLLVIKIDPDGNVLWGRALGGTTRQTCSGLSVAPDGRILVVANFVESMTFGAETLSAPAGVTNGALLALSPDGEPTWALPLSSSSYSIARKVAVDGEGYAALTGYFYEGVMVGSESLLSRGDVDAFVARISPTGETAWLRQLGESAREVSRTLAVGPEGQVAVGLSFSGILSLDGLSEPFIGSYDGGILVLDQTGKAQHIHVLGGDATQDLNALAFSPSGELLASGYHHGTLVTPLGDITNAGGDDLYLARFSPAGELEGVQRLGGMQSEWSPTLLATDEEVLLTFLATGDVPVGSETAFNRGGIDAHLVSFTR